MLRAAPGWDRRISRAEQLAATGGATAALLAAYARVLRSQRAMDEALARAGVLAGSLARDAPHLVAAAQQLLEETAAHGPALLADEARRLQAEGGAELLHRLIEYARDGQGADFFAKAILQAYGERLAAAGVARGDGDRTHADNRCPRCGGPPQVSFLEAMSSADGDGGGRSLVCARCLAAWPFRRVRCPACGEDEERRLSYYHGDDLNHLRLDVCETCGRYVKTIDLTKLGVAVPLVDEVAGAPLDLWARERGFEKIELNLVGL
jgi:formate dehydrogenase maturation protein FdhE